MKKMILHILCLTAFLFFSSCGGKGGGRSVASAVEEIPLHYAENLTLLRTDSCTVAILRNPWDTTKILHTYLLVPEKSHGETLFEDSFPALKQFPQATVIRVPVQNALVYSSVHCYLLSILHAENAIGGVCDAKYNLLPFVGEGCQSGRIADCGTAAAPDPEKVIELHPDLIMLSPYENSGSYGRIAKLRIPILECADYMETSPLGRAEWMKFYGILFGCEQKADSLFAEVERNYRCYCDMAKVAQARPRIFTGLRYGAVWYVSGGKSTISQLFADAGLEYVFAGRQGRGADPLSFESVFDQAGDADVWFIPYFQNTDKSYREIAQEYAPYAQFAAFKNRRIFGCNTAKTAYYEETTFCPDRLLRDLIIIAHPEIMPAERTTYFRPLAE